MGKYILRSERHRLVACYNIYNAKAGREDAEHDVVRQGVPKIINDISMCEEDKHEVL